jgi:hypothetical protein
LGLVVAPRIRFLQKSQQQQQKKAKNSVQKFEEESQEPSQAEEKNDEHNDKPLNFSDLTHSNPNEDDEDDDLFTVKQVFKYKPNMSNDQSSQSGSQDDTQSDSDLEDPNVIIILYLFFKISKIRN